ncbi:hypothetical protein [Bartonella florencae]|uniref:hypothetical protein n=1 Tax=Bartonella florencae TaxID=928210 RepID=UPI0002D5EAE2|nr:hypothetical protein [Bartonella florencae]
MNKIIEQNRHKNFGEQQKDILRDIIVPYRINLFKNSNTYFKIERGDRSLFRSMELRNLCGYINSSNPVDHEWVILPDCAK